MILFELTETENDPVYQTLQVSNGIRQYDFLRSIVEASLSAERLFLSQAVIKALNFHAIACLHTNAGEYRPWFVEVGDYKPPPHFRVRPLMDDFVNVVNRNWAGTDPVTIATFVLWRMNHIHPFINGNGRTARAAAYFTLCVRSGRLLPGKVTLPELLTRERPRYVAALKAVDAGLPALNLGPLHTLMQELIAEQLASEQ